MVLSTLGVWSTQDPLQPLETMGREGCPCPDDGGASIRGDRSEDGDDRLDLSEGAPHGDQPAVEKGRPRDQWGRLIGRTNGGMNTKLQAVTDADGYQRQENLSCCRTYRASATPRLVLDSSLQIGVCTGGSRCASARRAVQQGFITLEMSLRWLLRNFGLKVGTISRGWFEQRIRELTAGNPMLEAATEPILSARPALRRELAGLERNVWQLAQADPVCRRLMSMLGIGAVVALTYRSVVDDPARFTSSKKVGPWGALTSTRNQSGERDISGGIAKVGDVNLRRTLCQGAILMMHRGRVTWLRTWIVNIARRRGTKLATVALARRIAVILHRM